MQEVRKRNKINETVVPSKSKDNGNDGIKKNVGDPRQQSSSKNISLRVFSRVVVIFSLLIVVYFSSKDEKLKVFARQSDLLAGKGQVLDCSPIYLKDLDKYEGCFPKECKRFVTDKAISQRETEELLMIAQKGLQLDGSYGGVTTLDLDSGILSNGQQFLNIYQNNRLMFASSDFNVYRVVKEKIKYAIAHHFGVEPSKIYLTHPALFTEIKQFSSKKIVTTQDEYWHPHVDNELHTSHHYTALLYLSDYNKEFKGSRFVFMDENVNKTIEPRKGRLSMFTSGLENRYYVEKITSGVKYYISFYFTCDKQYAIEDPSTNKYIN